MRISLLVNERNRCSDDFGCSISFYFLEAIDNGMWIDWREPNRDLKYQRRSHHFLSHRENDFT